MDNDMDFGDLSPHEVAERVVGNGCRKVTFEMDATNLSDEDMSNFIDAITEIRCLQEKIGFAYDEDHVKCADEIAMTFEYKKGMGDGCVEKVSRYF